MSEELKPCPCCGAHQPRVIKGEGKKHSIICTECPVRAEFFSSTWEQAVAAWNRRATPPSTPSNPQAGGQEVQNIMFEVFEYAKLSEGIDKAEGEARAYQRDAMLQQDRKIRSMIADLAAPVALSPVPPAKAADHERAQWWLALQRLPCPYNERDHGPNWHVSAHAWTEGVVAAMRVIDPARRVPAPPG